MDHGSEMFVTTEDSLMYQQSDFIPRNPVLHSEPLKIIIIIKNNMAFSFI